jgi:hypothetical protein
MNILCLYLSYILLIPIELLSRTVTFMILALPVFSIVDYLSMISCLYSRSRCPWAFPALILVFPALPQTKPLTPYDP